MTPLQKAVSWGHSAAVWTFIKRHKVDISQYDEVRYSISILMLYLCHVVKLCYADNMLVFITI